MAKLATCAWSQRHRITTMKRMAKHLARNLRTLMDERDLTQEAVADLAGLSQSHISLLLNQRRTPSIDVVMDLAEGLGVSPLDLLRDN